GALAFTPDGRSVILSSGERGEPATVAVRDVSGASRIWQEPPRDVRQLALLPGGRELAVAQGNTLTRRPGRVRFWDLATRRPTSQVEDELPLLACMAVSPDG